MTDTVKKPSKKEIIEKLKNNSFASFKQKPVENSSGDKHRALMRYNAMLDNVAIGAHTQTTVNIAGIDWDFRLLTGKEQNAIRKEVLNQLKAEDCFEDFNLQFWTMVKIVTKSLSPSPFKTEGKEIWTEEDIANLPDGLIETLYITYIDFDSLSTQRPTELSYDEVEAMVDVVKKKPEELKKLGRWRLLATSISLAESCKRLESIVKSATNN
jgi:hypothetical protein